MSNRLNYCHCHLIANTNLLSIYIYLITYYVSDCVCRSQLHAREFVSFLFCGVCILLLWISDMQPTHILPCMLLDHLIRSIKAEISRHHTVLNSYCLIGLNLYFHLNTGHKRSQFGRGQIITVGDWWNPSVSQANRSTRVLWAGSDPRADGCAQGY